MARTAGKLMLVAALVGAWGCESKTSETPQVATESRRAVLAHTDGLVGKALSDFVTAAQTLESSVLAWRSDPNKLGQAQEAFHAAMDTWQQVEVVQVGPLAAMGVSPGAADLRDFIYSWPLTNPCRIDQATANSEYTDLSGAAVNIRGLDALEYLLFVDGTGNACPENSTLNSSGQWAALGPSEVGTRRADFATAVAADLVANAKVAQGGHSDFSPGFVEGDSPFSSQREAMNALTTAMFYLEQEVKDMKVAPPIGVSDCATATCPEAIESRFAGRSLRNVRINLETFRAVFVADDTTGFDALLAEAGGVQTANDIVGEVDAALAILAQLQRDFPEAIEPDAAELELLFQHLRSLSTLLKTEFITLLDLDLPAKAEGDND